MSSQQIEDEEAAAIELNKTSKFYKRSSKLLELSLTFISLDPFAVYKRYKYQTSKHVGRLQSLWSAVSIPMSAYLSIKPLTVLLLRWLRKILTAHKSGQIYNTVHIVNWLLTLIGDPVASLSFVASIAYLYFPFIVLNLTCYLPLYFRHYQQPELTFARFQLRPQEEIRRFDLYANRILKLVIKSFEKYPSFRGAQSDRTNPSNQVEWIGCKTQQQLHGMKDLKRQIPKIRPKSLGADWHKRSYEITMIVLVVFMATDNSAGILLTGYCINIAWSEHCDARQKPARAGEQANWQRCSLLDAFSAPDLLMIFELFLLINLFTLTAANIFHVIHLLQVRHQLHLTEDITDRTRGLVDELRGWSFRGQLKVKKRTLSERLSGRLCANIIAMWVFQRETRKCVRMLTNTTRYAIANCFVLTASSVASIATLKSLANGGRSASGSSVQDVTVAQSSLKIWTVVLSVAWLIIWCHANVLLISCAMIPSKISQLSRSVYSLTAQLIRLQAEQRTLHELRLLRVRDSRIRPDDPITSLWRRLAHGESSSAEQLVVRVPTNDLTYEGVLAINFYVLTIISLLTMLI